MVFDPLDFIAKLAALIPKPRVNLSRFHGVFASNSKYRALITPSRRGKGKKCDSANERLDQSPAERRASMTWAQRLKRVFNIDINTCRECGGSVRVIACIEDPVVINKILDHLNEKGGRFGGSDTSRRTGATLKFVLLRPIPSGISTTVLKHAVLNFFSNGSTVRVRFANRPGMRCESSETGGNSIEKSGIQPWFEAIR